MNLFIAHIPVFVYSRSFANGDSVVLGLLRHFICEFQMLKILGNSRKIKDYARNIELHP